MFLNDLESLETGILNDCKSGRMKNNVFERGAIRENRNMEGVEYYGEFLEQLIWHEQTFLYILKGSVSEWELINLCHNGVKLFKFYVGLQIYLLN